MNLRRLLFVVIAGLALAACSPKESTDVVWLNHFVAGQIRVAPETKVDADNVTFYEQGTDKVISIDKLVAGRVYDFAKTIPSPSQRWSSSSHFRTQQNRPISVSQRTLTPSGVQIGR